MITPGKSSIGFSGFEKLTFLVEISKISKIVEKITNSSRKALLLYELSEREPGWRFTTARCHTKTIAKLPRTQVHMTVKIIFLMNISSISLLGSPIIVIDIVLKIWIELIKWRNDNTMEKFYGLWTFQKSRFLVEISKISKIFEKLKIPWREALLLYEGN